MKMTQFQRSIGQILKNHMKKYTSCDERASSPHRSPWFWSLIVQIGRRRNFAGKFFKFSYRPRDCSRVNRMSDVFRKIRRRNRIIISQRLEDFSPWDAVKDESLGCGGQNWKNSQMRWKNGKNKEKTQSSASKSWIFSENGVAWRGG